MWKYLFRKLHQKEKRRKLFYERLTEPLHLNLISLFVAIFGSYRQKIEFDLIIRQQYAFCILKAADIARWSNLKSITLIEFGVGQGSGLLNMCEIAKRVTKETGILFNIFGFDTGKGMPEPVDYRDHPEFFKQGFIPMPQKNELLKALPSNARLIIGNIADTLPNFMKSISVESPIGFVAIDVDYYSSAKECLKIFTLDSGKYLSVTPVYLDDISWVTSNPWVGELLAINEFNNENIYRKICPYPFLQANRIFKNASWINRIYIMHTLDHELRSPKHGPTFGDAPAKNYYL